MVRNSREKIGLKKQDNNLTARTTKKTDGQIGAFTAKVYGIRLHDEDENTAKRIMESGGLTTMCRCVK